MGRTYTGGPPWGSVIWAASCMFEEGKEPPRHVQRLWGRRDGWPGRREWGPTAIKVSYDQAQRLHSGQRFQETQHAHRVEKRLCQLKVRGQRCMNWENDITISAVVKSRGLYNCLVVGEAEPQRKGDTLWGSQDEGHFWDEGATSEELRRKKKKDPVTKLSIFLIRLSKGVHVRL